jgi:WXG100 family type VII secretion target
LLIEVEHLKRKSTSHITKANFSKEERGMKMGKRIKVTPQELETASKKLTELSETYTGIYTQLMQAAGTMGEAWEGEDNLAFVDQINGFNEDLKNMADKLATAGQALEAQRANYVATQENNMVQVRKLTN